MSVPTEMILSPHDSSICPVVTLKAYEERTASHREAESRLFLSIIKPYKAIASSAVARWLKCTLESAGIDTLVFNAHSVRGASTTAAANLGITTYYLCLITFGSLANTLHITISQPTLT